MHPRWPTCITKPIFFSAEWEEFYIIQALDVDIHSILAPLNSFANISYSSFRIQ